MSCLLVTFDQRTTIIPITNKIHPHNHFVHGIGTQRQLSSQPLQQIRINRPSVHAIFHSILLHHPLSNNNPSNDSTFTGISSPFFTAFAIRSSLASSPSPHISKDISTSACSTPGRAEPPASSPSPPTALRAPARTTAWTPARASREAKTATSRRAVKRGSGGRLDRALGFPEPRGSDSRCRRRRWFAPSPSRAAPEARPSLWKERRCDRFPLASSHPTWKHGDETTTNARLRKASWRRPALRPRREGTL